MQSYSESQRKALAAFSMVKGGLGAGLDVQDLLKAVEPALADENVREFFDAFMREDIATYEAIANKDLEYWQSRRADFIALQTKVTLAAEALIAARAELETLCATLPGTLQWTSAGFIKREFRRQDSELKAGRKTKARDEDGNFQGKDKGHIYVPCEFRIVASAPLKEHNARCSLRKLGNEQGRWIARAWISLLNGETLAVEFVEPEVTKALDKAYVELAQRLLELGIMTTEELGFVKYPLSKDNDKRHQTSLTHRPRDVMGADGYKKDTDYVELKGEDRYV